jgi:hypothetical protein
MDFVATIADYARDNATNSQLQTGLVFGFWVTPRNPWRWLRKTGQRPCNNSDES